VERNSHTPELRATRTRSNAAMPSLPRGARCQSGLKEVDEDEDEDEVAAEERDILLPWPVLERWKGNCGELMNMNVKKAVNGKMGCIVPSLSQGFLEVA
jgi:hypothetical protein